MYRDDETELHREALGVVAALTESATGDGARQNLRSAYEVLEKALPEVATPAPARVGVHRRAADFEKAHELLMALSLCPGVDRSHVILSMIFVSRAETLWVTVPTGRFAIAMAQRRRRRTDAADERVRAASEKHAIAAGEKRPHAAGETRP